MNILTLDINQAAEFLIIATSTAYELAENGTLPGAKIGKKWVFIETELAQYLSDEVSRQQRERAERAGLEKATPAPVAPKKVTNKKETSRINPSIESLPQMPSKAA